MDKPKVKRRKPLEALGIYKFFPLYRLPLSVGMKIILVFSVLIIIGFFVTLRLSLNLIYDNIWRETEDKLSTDLKIADMMYDTWCKSIEAIVDFTAGRFFLAEEISKGETETLRSQLERIRHDRGLDFFTLTDREGVVMLRTAAPYAKGDDVSGDILVCQALSGRKAAGTVLLDHDRMGIENEMMVMRSHIVVKPTEHTLPGALDVVHPGLVVMAAYPVFDSRGELLGVLYGGKLISNDTGLVDSIMERMFPNAGDKNVNFAMVSFFLWDVRVSTSLRLPNGNRAVGYRMFSQVSESVLGNDRNWLGTSWVVQDWYFAAYEPIRDPEGKVIGSLGIGLWKGPFIAIRDAFIWRYVKISCAGLLVVVLLGVVFSRMLTKPLRELVEASADNCVFHV